MHRLPLSTLFLGSAIFTLGFASDKAFVQPWGVELSYMDRAVKPGDDFFAYANGGWLKTAQIPPARSYYGVMIEHNEKNETRMKSLVDELLQKKNLTDEEKKLCDLYEAFMDRTSIEAKDVKPIEKDLAKLKSINSYEEVAQVMGNPALRISGPFKLKIKVEDKHPSSYALALEQSGLGLPNRDYYLRNDKSFVSTREAYKAYISEMLGYVGVKDAIKRADLILKLEKSIADVSWPAEDCRDPNRTYNPMKISELKRFAPQFPWDVFLNAAAIPMKQPHIDRMVLVLEKSAFPRLAAVFGAAPVSVWRDYLFVRYLHEYAEYLPKRFEDTDFSFYSKTLKGQKEQLNRATRGVYLLDSRIGEALGKIYVAQFFPLKTKKKVQMLVANLMKAFETELQTSTWMAPETRSKALEKLHKFNVKIGYPDKWRDYSMLAIDRNNLIQSIQNANLFDWGRKLKRIDQPVDKTEWGMTPPTNNAYYHQSANEIVFPAGILQPPFFDPNADDAVNYGAIGTTIGHEISHGFDDEGSKYDGDGVLENWWTDADLKNFENRTSALAKQYDNYEPLKGIHVNGKLTLGENIADLAGLVIAYKAYHISLGGKTPPVLDGFTGDQRFYLAYSQRWRQKTRDEMTRVWLLSNPHSPVECRVNGVVRNDDNWYAAFPEINKGNKYYLPSDQRVRLW